MVARRMSHRHASEPRGVNKNAQVKRRDADLLKKEQEAAARKERRRVAALAKAADEQRRLEARIHNEQLATEAEASVALDTAKGGARTAKATTTLTAPRKTARTKPTMAETAPAKPVKGAHPVVKEEQVSPLDQAKRRLWLLSDARHLMRQGYSLESVMTRTGWPADMLEDVKVGAW